MADHESKKQKKRRIVLNLIVCSLYLTLLATSDIPLESMQSSYNIESGMGTISLSIGIAVSLVSLFFLTSLLTEWLGLKTLVVAGTLSVSVFSLANLHPTWATLIPAAIVLKVVSCLGRSSNYAMITYFSENFSKLSDLSKEKIYSVIFGVAMTMESSGCIFGSLVSYFVSNYSCDDQKINATSTLTGFSRERCGSYFKDGEYASNSNFEKLPQFYLYILFGTFAGLAALASLMAFLFLDAVIHVESNGNRCSLVLDTFRLAKNKTAILLIICDFHRGFWNGVLVTDFAKAFDVCLGGLQLLGLAAACFGIGNAIFAAFFSWLAKQFNRWLVFLIITVLEVGSIVVSLLWSPNWFPNHDQLFVLSLSAIMGAGYAGNAFLFYMLHGYLYPNKKEASMALCTLAENLGISVSLGLSSILPFTSKLYILLTIMSVAVVCYLGVEMPLNKPIKPDAKETSTSAGVCETNLCLRD